MQDWVADGRRPWHTRFLVRDTSAGAVGLWIGHYNAVRYEMALRTRKAAKDQPERYSALSGTSWAGLVARGLMANDAAIGPHDGPCTPCGWLGMGFLPQDPRPATMPWPNWRHLAHTTTRCDGLHLHPRDCTCWEALIPVFDALAAESDDTWLATLGQHPLGVIR